MTLHPSELLGKDLEFSARRLTVVAYDPAKGWKLSIVDREMALGWTDSWLPTEMLSRLLYEGILVAAVLLLLVLPARAQDVPTAVFAGASAADWVTTYRFAVEPNAGRETNRMVGWLQPHSPAAMVALGTATDVAGVMLWRKATGRHTRVYAVGLYAMSAYRIYLAARNTRYVNRLHAAQAAGHPYTFSEVGR